MSPIFEVTAAETGQHFLAVNCQDPKERFDASMVLDVCSPGGGEPPSPGHLQGEYAHNWLARVLSDEVASGQLETVAIRAGRLVAIVRKPVSSAQIDEMLGEGSAAKLFPSVSE